MGRQILKTIPWIVIALLVIYGLYYGFFLKKAGPWGLEFEKIDIPQKYLFAGEWEMSSILKNCDESSLNGLELSYTLVLRQKSRKAIEGYGEKIGEIRNGHLENYGKPTPFLVEGAIRNDILILSFFEKGSNREVWGEITIPIDSSRFRYFGEYEGNNNDCDGEIILERIIQAE